MLNTSFSFDWVFWMINCSVRSLINISQNCLNIFLCIQLILFNLMLRRLFAVEFRRSTASGNFMLVVWLYIWSFTSTFEVWRTSNISLSYSAIYTLLHELTTDYRSGKQLCTLKFSTIRTEFKLQKNNVLPRRPTHKISYHCGVN